MPNKETDKYTNQNGDSKNNIDENEKKQSDIISTDAAQNTNDVINNTHIESTMQGAVIPKTPAKQADENNTDTEENDISAENDHIPVEIEIKKLHRKMSSSNKGPNRTVLRILMICLIILGSVAGVYLYSFLQNEKYLALIDTNTFYSGIYVDNIHLGGLTKEQAIDQISAQQKTKESEIMVTVTWDEEEYFFYNTDVNINYDTEQIINEAYQIGRMGTNKERYNIVLDLSVNNVSFVTAREIDPSPIEQMVRDIALSKVQNVSEPAVEFNPDPEKIKDDWFIYSDPIPGVQTDDEALWNSVAAEFTNQTFGIVPVPKWEIKPDEEIDFREITKLVISFRTKMARNSNREHNIALCCSMINGTVVMPGDEFSMNDTTGERTKAKGFKEANTIVGGNELVPGIAGGVCQVSGTLFNAALMADLEITERYHHSFELGYLTRGRDATVNYGTADLKFVNNHDYPIYIAMFTEGLDVYAEIYGAPLTNCDYISIWVKTTKTIPIGDPIYVKDSTVPAGSEPKYLKGHKGITCQVYKIYNDKDGNQIASELAYTDVYKYYAPELHVNPADYEGYINPTPEPVVPTPTPEPGVG